MMMMMMIPVHGWYTSLSLLLLLRLGVAEGPERLLVFGAQPLQLWIATALTHTEQHPAGAVAAYFLRHG